MKGSGKSGFPKQGSIPPAGDHGDDKRDRKDNLIGPTVPSHPVGTIRKKVRRVVLVPPKGTPYNGKMTQGNQWEICDAETGKSLGSFPTEGVARDNMDAEGYYE